MTKLWIDADAIPNIVRDIVVAAAVRLKLEAIFVANKRLYLPESPLLSSVIVNSAPDAADNYIKDNAKKFDLVVTQDIPLAHMLVPLGVVVIDPRGEVFTEDNIGPRISMRNLMEDLRNAGEITGGPKQFGEKEKRAFAAAFDRQINKLIKIQQKN